MSSEGYSRKAFEENEKKISEARKTAKLTPFEGYADPADIMSARFEYAAGKEEGKDLLPRHTKKLLRKTLLVRLVQQKRNELRHFLKIKDRIKKILKEKHPHFWGRC